MSEEFENRQELEDNRESMEAGEAVPETAEAAAEQAKEEAAALSKSAEQQAADLGTEGAEAVLELNEALQAETDKTLESIAQTKKEVLIDAGVGEMLSEVERFKQSKDQQREEEAARTQEIESSLEEKRQKIDAELATKRDEMDETFSEMAAPEGMVEARRAEKMMASATAETDPEKKKQMIEDAWEAGKEALSTDKKESGEQTEQSESDLLSVDELMPEDTSEDWKALSGEGTIEEQVQRQEAPVEMTAEEQAEREAEAAALLEKTEQPAADSLDLDELMPEGASDEWEALSVKGGTIEEQVQRQEQVKPTEVTDEMIVSERMTPEARAERGEKNKEALAESVEKTKAATALRTETQERMLAEGVDISALEGALSDADSAFEKLLQYEDRPLEMYADLLSKQQTELTSGRELMESKAKIVEDEMDDLEAEDIESGMETDQDGETSLARFVDIESQIAVADQHLEDLQKQIASTEDETKRADLMKEVDSLKDHLQTLEDKGSIIIDKAGELGAEQDFMARVDKYKERKKVREKALTKIENLRKLEDKVKEQGGLLEKVMIERDESIDIEVDDRGDEIAEGVMETMTRRNRSFRRSSPQAQAEEPALSEAERKKRHRKRTRKRLPES
jgi:hypothetical protein